MSQESSTAPVARADRVPLWLTALFWLLLVSVIGVLSYLLWAMTSQPRYASPGQLEIETYRAAVREAPGDVPALLALGQAYQKASQFDEALACYEDVLELAPDDLLALHNKAVILFDGGRTDEAAETLRTVLSLDGGHVVSAKMLAEHYAGEGEYQLVLDVVLPAAERTPGAADLHFLAGLAFERLGDPEEAIACYRLALGYYPDMRDAHEALVRLGATP